MTLERGAHPFFIAKTAAAGDAVDALLGFFQQAPGGFQPEQFDCFGRSAAGLCLVASSEVSRTHAHAFGEQIDIQPFVAEMPQYPWLWISAFAGMTGESFRTIYRRAGRYCH